MIEEMKRLGAIRGHVWVKLAGGASVMDPGGFFDIGKRNILAAKRILWGSSLGPVAEDTGGSLSRTVSLAVADGGTTICVRPGDMDDLKLAEGDRMKNYDQVLIVDDSSTSRMIIQRCVQMAGIEVSEYLFAENGLDAFSALRSNAGIELIITDINMPKMDGRTFATLIMETRRWPGSPSSSYPASPIAPSRPSCARSASSRS